MDQTRVGDGKMAISRDCSSLMSAMLAVALLGGCSTTQEDIERWKGTEKGPGKLREAVKNGSLPAALRSGALVALVEIDMLGDALGDLKDVPEGERHDVVHGAVKPLVAMAQGDPKDANSKTKRLQRNGSDALFALRGFAAPADRDALDDAVVDWLMVDLTGRATSGGNSAEKIVTTIGPRAAPRLAALIGADATSDGDRTEAARFLGKVGDREAREQAGAKLVERALRERRLQESTLFQIGLVGGDHATVYLNKLAEDPHALNENRTKALFALAQTADPASLPTALKLAGDTKADGAIRDAAFELAEKLGPPAVPGLARLLTDKEEKVRWRAFEGVVGAGKAAAIPTALEGLLPTVDYPPDDLKEFIVHQLTPLGFAGLPALRAELKSKSWVARLAAAWALAEIGKPADAPLVEALAADTTKLKGKDWPAGATVGSQAKEFAARLRAKK